MIKALQKKFIRAAMIAISALILAILIGINIFNLVSQNNQIRSNLELLSRFGSDRGLAPGGGMLPDGVLPDGGSVTPESGLQPSEGETRGRRDYDQNGSMAASEVADDDDDTDDDIDDDADDDDETIIPGSGSGNGRGGRLPERTDEDRFMTLTYFMVRFNNEGTIVYTDVSRISSVTESSARALAAEVYEGTAISGRMGSYIYQLTDNGPELGKTVTFMDTSEQRTSFLRILIVSIAIGVAAWLIMLGFVILLSRKAIRPIAENIERQKQFVTNAGHELKTPLAIIQANADAMELFNGENKWTTNIKAQVTRMSELTSNLLTLSRMDESADNMLMEDLDLSEIVQDNVKTFAGPFSLKGVALEKDIREGLHIRGDRAQIKQLMSLLFDNAVKYVNEGGNAKVSLSGTDKKAVFTIQNTCEELPTSAPERLFDRFYRSDESHSQKTGGHGIGLSVVSSIVSNHNGKVKAEYIEPNIVRFIVTL